MQVRHAETPAAISPLRSHLVLAIALGLSAFLASVDALACAACGSTLSRDWESQGISGKAGITADLSYDYLNQDRQRYGTSAASSTLINSQYANGQEVEAYTKTNTISASLIYNADTWGVSAVIPYVNRSHGTYGSGTPGTVVDGSTLTTSSDSGIGDIKIIGRYNGFSADNSSGVIGGIKLPTGNTGAHFSDGVTPLDAGLQIGTGSTDVILGGYTTGAFHTYGWFIQGTLQHAVATKKALGDLDYRPGDVYSLNSGIRYAVFGAKISPMLQLNIVKKQADSGAFTVPTDPVTGAPVSGGTLAYLAPGVTMRVGGGASVYGFVQVPIYQNVNSLQLTPGYILTLGVRQSF